MSVALWLVLLLCSIICRALLCADVDEVPRKKRKKTGSEPEEEQVEVGKMPTSSKKQKSPEARKAKTKVNGVLVPTDDPQQVLNGNSDPRNEGVEVGCKSSTVSSVLFTELSFKDWQLRLKATHLVIR